MRGKWFVARNFSSLLLLALIGCSQSEPRFRLNMEGPEKANLDRRIQQAVVDATVALFGTPDEPYVIPESGLDLQKLQLAAGPTWSNREGTRHGLYRQHCAHCHGVTGDGAGPTALFLNPYPRDYRKGIFKFTSTGSTPTTADLKRTLIDGIAGTAMPSFALLPDDEVEALVEYVKYLAIRGQTEAELFRVIDGLKPGDFETNTNAKIPTPPRDELVTGLVDFVGMWKEAQEKVVIPPARPTPVDTPEQLAASIEAGRKLFQDQKRAQCTKCHGPTGLGDSGDVQYDDWNKDKKGTSPQLWLLPIQELKPRNLRLGIYRGGRRPLDLYRRIHAGIPGANMPATNRPGAPAVLQPEEIWSLVDYLLSLPYETGSPKPTGHTTTGHTTAHLNMN